MTAYDPYNDPYDFVRTRAAQLLDEGDVEGAGKLLDVVDRAQIKLLKKVLKARKVSKKSRH